MNEGGRRFALILGVVAAAAGVAVASYIIYDRYYREEREPLRSVSDVLSDCYNRMREIQRNLSEWHPEDAPPAVQG